MSATIFLTTDQRESHSLNYTNVYFLRKCLKHKLDMEERFEEVSNIVGSACKGETDLVLIWSHILRNAHKVSQDLTANYEFIYGEIYVTFPIFKC